MGSSIYPGAIDNNASLFSDVTAGTLLGPGHWNNLRDAIMAIELALGISPEGTYADVAARLAALTSAGGGGGGGAGVAVYIADVPGQNSGAIGKINNNVTPPTGWTTITTLALPAGSFLCWFDARFNIPNGDYGLLIGVQDAAGGWLTSKSVDEPTGVTDQYGGSGDFVLATPQTVSLVCGADTVGAFWQSQYLFGNTEVMQVGLRCVKYA